MDTLLASTSPIVKSFLAGSVSGTFSTVLFQPLDLVKTRLQSTSSINTIAINGSTITAERNGMLKVFETIIRNERVSGLWKGFSPSFYRCVPGVGMYFSCLHALKSAAFPNGKEAAPLEALALGAFARTLTATAMLPMTVVKTRYECGSYAYRNVPSALKEIYIVEGKHGLYKGLVATLVRDAPFSGLYLMFYSQAKQKVAEFNGGLQTKGLAHFGCGIFAGTCASVITQPADVIKTTMQIKQGQHKMPEVIMAIYNKNGMNGFFKGLVPRVMRRTLIAAMAWTVYEEMMHQLGLKT